jgi:hypothetical protein
VGVRRKVITDLMRALWRVSLMLALNRSLLNRECSEGLGFDHFYV